MPAPIPITLGITDLDVGGAERALVEIATRLDRERWRPSVVCLGPPGRLVEVLEAADVPVECLGARSVLDLGVVRRMTAVLRELQPRLLQTFLFHANVVGRIAGRRAGVPRIVSGVRVADRRGAWRHWIDRWTAGGADHHVCVSEAVAEFTARRSRIPRSRMTVIPNGVDVDRFGTAEPADLTEFGIPPAARVLLFVGRLDPQKDPLLLLDAFDEIAAREDDVHLLLVGDGPMRASVERRIEGSASADRIHLVGRRNDVPNLMRAATTLVLPSRFEGMPNVVLEAMAAGLPVVTTAVEGTDELVAPGETGLVVPVGKRGELRDALLEVLSNPGLAAAFAVNAQRIIRKRFAIDTVVESYADIYTRLLESTPDRHS